MEPHARSPIHQSPALTNAKTPAWLITLLLLLAILPYVNTLQNGFVYDDNNEVLTNPYIRSFSHVGDIFSTRILAHLGARGATNYYRPISIFGFLICYKLFGLLPYGFHLANLLLHALIGVPAVRAYPNVFSRISGWLSPRRRSSRCTLFTPNRWRGFPELRTSTWRCFTWPLSGFSWPAPGRRGRARSGCSWAWWGALSWRCFRRSRR